MRKFKKKKSFELGRPTSNLDLIWKWEDTTLVPDLFRWEPPTSNLPPSAGRLYEVRLYVEEGSSLSLLASPSLALEPTS